MRLAARFTALVVLPTPPFWLASVINVGGHRASDLSRARQGFAMFHVEHCTNRDKWGGALGSRGDSLSPRCSTWNIAEIATGFSPAAARQVSPWRSTASPNAGRASTEMFHVKHSTGPERWLDIQIGDKTGNAQCSTWNIGARQNPGGRTQAEQWEGRASLWKPTAREIALFHVEQCRWETSPSCLSREYSTWNIRSKHRPSSQQVGATIGSGLSTEL